MKRWIAAVVAACLIGGCSPSGELPQSPGGAIANDTPAVPEDGVGSQPLAGGGKPIETAGKGEDQLAKIVVTKFEPIDTEGSERRYKMTIRNGSDAEFFSVLFAHHAMVDGEERRIGRTLVEFEEALKPGEERVSEGFLQVLNNPANGSWSNERFEGNNISDRNGEPIYYVGLDRAFLP